MIPGLLSRGTRISRCLILGEDGISGGIAELDGISGGIAELDGISGGLSIVAGESGLMIPGPPSRGTSISRRLILGGLFCHDQVVSGGCTEEPGTRNTETRNFFGIFNKKTRR